MGKKVLSEPEGEDEEQSPSSDQEEATNSDKKKSKAGSKKKPTPAGWSAAKERRSRAQGWIWIKKDQSIEQNESLSEKESDLSDQERESSSKKRSKKTISTVEKTAKRRTKPNKTERESSSSDQELEPEKDEKEEPNKEHEEEPEAVEKTEKVETKDELLTPKKSDNSESVGKSTNGTEESEKAPAAAKAAADPTDDQLKATIQDLLKDADLKNHTMKILSQKVYALYPNSNLEATKKDFIRATAKSLLVDVELT